VVDSLSPKISFKKKSAISVSFTIEDKMSGISRYNMFINNKWVIAEYDAKSGELTYYFDESSPKGTLKYRVEAEDKVGNSSKFYHTLKR
jgi:hypothetical protein